MAIFINYRRDDTKAFTGRVDEHLRRALPNEEMFLDIDAIPLGTDFVEHIQSKVKKCDVLIAIIGDKWLTLRLHEESDFVRIEIEAALSRKIPVIPILADGATMPKPDELPESLRPLLRHQGIAIDSGRTFKIQIQHLIDGIKQLRNNDIRKTEEPTAKVDVPNKVIRSTPGDCELVLIPGGHFQMGSPGSEEGRRDNEGPVRKVEVPSFYLGRYPVTDQEYRRFMKANSKAKKPKYWEEGRFNQQLQPVVGVDWEDANAFAEWVGGRLPTEAEWEYSCRAGTSTRFYSGDTIDDLEKVGWCRGNSKDALHPVGEKKPNAYGLYDMHGNIWEWVEDDSHDNYEGAASDERAWVGSPRRGLLRMLRGGSWSSFPRVCRSAARREYSPDFRYNGVGFRVALDIK